MTDTTTTQDTQTGQQQGSPGTTTTDPAAAAGGGGAPPAADAWLADTGWVETLPAELKGDVNLARYKTPVEAFRALHMANKRFGIPQERLLTVPDKTRAEDPAAWAAFDKLNGVPDDVAGYGLTLPDDTPAEVKTKFEALAGELRAEGVGKAAFDKVMKTFVDGTQAMKDAETEARNQRLTELKGDVAQEFGAKLGYYQTEAAKLLLDAKGADGKPLIGEEGLKRLEELGFGESRDFIRLMAWVIDQRAEPESLPGTGAAASQPGLMTPAQAKAARLELENGDKGRILRDSRHPQHKSVVDERLRLFALERGERPAA
jgi:hypothetical protein